MSSEGCRSICVGQKYTCYVLKYLSTKSSIQCRCANKFEFEQKRSLAVCMCVRKHTHIHAHTHTGLCKHTRTLTQKKGWFIVRWEQQALVPSFVKINVFVNVRGWGHLCFKKKYLCQHLTELVQTKSRGVSKTFLLFRFCPCPYHHMLPPITNPSHPQAIRPLSPIRLIHKQSAPYHIQYHTHRSFTTLTIVNFPNRHSPYPHNLPNRYHCQYLLNFCLELVGRYVSNHSQFVLSWIHTNWGAGAFVIPEKIFVSASNRTGSN